MARTPTPRTPAVKEQLDTLHSALGVARTAIDAIVPLLPNLTADELDAHAVVATLREATRKVVGDNGLRQRIEIAERTAIRKSRRQRVVGPDEAA